MFMHLMNFLLIAVCVTLIIILTIMLIKTKAALSDLEKKYPQSDFKITAFS